MESINAISSLLQKISTAVGLLSIAMAQVQQPAIYTVTPNPPKDIWEGYGTLKKICIAESNRGGTEPHQFYPDGKRIIWGYDKDKNTGEYKEVKRDVGACQINTDKWLDQANSMGLDIINSEKDNIKFAKWLYDREGWVPWSASKDGPNGWSGSH